MDIDDDSTTTFQFTVTGATPGIVYAIDGNATGPTVLSKSPVTVNGDQWTVALSKVPYVMEVPVGTVPSTTTGDASSTGTTGTATTGSTTSEDVNGAKMVSVSVLLVFALVSLLF